LRPPPRRSPASPTAYTPDQLLEKVRPR